MGCSCDKNINCNNGEECPCGLSLKLYNSSGDLLETLSGYGYSIGDENYFQFEQGITFPTGTLLMSYNDSLARWELTHNDNSLYLPDTSMLFGTYTTDALCPDTDCDLDLGCNTLEFQFVGTSVGGIEWQGDMYNGKKLYRFNTDDYPGSPNWENCIIYWGNNLTMQNNNGISTNRWLFVILGIYTLETIPFPLEQLDGTDPGAEMNLLGYLDDPSLECSNGQFQPPSTDGFPPRVATVPEGPQGYTGEVDKVECECCDEQISVTVLLLNIEYDFIIDVAKDLNDNVLGFNGKQYYSFTYNLPGAPVPNPTYYIYFNGNEWVVNDSLAVPGGEIHENGGSGDCPYGFYSKSTWDESIIQIKGVECFDCCDYYTPRFTNFIRKQRAILVDDTSYIKRKEVFGMKCGGDWEDIFRKHLIIDTLSCLPYGVLCEEQEECLIENLYKNCNC